MIGLAIEILKKYLPQIIGAVLIIAMYFWWRHEIIVDTEKRVNSVWIERDADTARQSTELLKLKQHEADQANKLNQERANNAIKIYAKHYDDMRAAADAIPQRVYIRTKTNCGGDTMPGAGADRSKVTQGSERTGQAELPESNLRSLNEVIGRVEEMQLKCEQLLNTVE